MPINIQRQFSIELKELIREARKVAVESSFDYISTKHFFIADCRIKRKGSLEKFAFKTEKEFNDFFESERNKELNLDILQTSLPLTQEAENAIRNASAEKKKYSQKVILPCHLFLAAALDKHSLFVSCFPAENDLYGKLVKFYEQEGLLNPAIPPRISWRQRITSFFKTK